MSLKRASTLFVLATLALANATATAAGGGPSGRLRTSPLDGLWVAKVTRAQFRRAGASAAVAAKLYGNWSVRHEDGRYELRNHRTGSVTRGTFTVRGKVFRSVSTSGDYKSRTMVCTWSIYRNRLTLKPIRGRPSQFCDAPVWIRAG